MPKKPHGYWTKENTIKEARELAKKLNTEYLPTQKETKKYNNSLSIYINKLFDSRLEFAKAAGLKLTQQQVSQEKAKNNKNSAYIKQQIHSIIEKLDIKNC